LTLDSQKILILGTGGASRDLVDLILDINAAAGRALWEPLGFLEDDPARQGRQYCGLPVVGPLSAAAGRPECKLINGIGSPGSYLNKPRLLAKTGAGPERFATLVHPSATISRWAALGPGCAVFAQAAVHNQARLGAQVMVLAASVVSHDVEVGDHACLASGVHLSGWARVGSQCYLGSGSLVRGEISVGQGSLVGMGSVLVRDVEPYSVVSGNPARLWGRVDPRGPGGRMPIIAQESPREEVSACPALA
jgi:sugar O-acyltransferase (sialic acid O-acetyltransferase NeuD family)